jgi:Kef-type K+ transport system membrane component KefB
MDSTLVVGIIIFSGFICGEIARKCRLPKITGYIVAGILLDPELFHIIPKEFPEHTRLVTNTALSFITFSVGGTLMYARLKILGKSIVAITLFEAEFAMIAVGVGCMVIFSFFHFALSTQLVAMIIPLSLLLGALASPTDPSATLAVTHEYQARGDVSSTILAVAAFDDVLGIMNYSLAVALAQIFVTHESFSVYSSLISPAVMIAGGITCGIIFGLALNLVTSIVKKESEGGLIVSVFAMLVLCFGTANFFHIDELLATMTMGVIVVNYNPKQDIIFSILERYTEDLIFVLFFTLSGMHLRFSALFNAYLFVALFVVLRMSGKFAGTLFGASISHATPNVKKYAAFGLLPQGGIVIGLALIIRDNPAFAPISDTFLSIIIGTTVIHELMGPIVAKGALAKAGEI